MPFPIPINATLLLAQGSASTRPSGQILAVFLCVLIVAAFALASVARRRVLQRAATEHILAVTATRRIVRRPVRHRRGR